MTSPKALLNAWNLHPKKSLGQNFLVDTSMADAIVQKARIRAEDRVLEIGSGLGAITVPAARNAQKLYALDLDRQLLELLETELKLHRLENVEIRHGDILKTDITALAQEAGGKLTVLGNLPYNISSQVLVCLVRARSAVPKAVLMLQKEMAQRAAAGPGSREYGRLGAMLGYCAKIRPLIDVPARAFYPRPKVDSRVIEVLFVDEPAQKAIDEEFLFRVIKAAFGKRRKTLRNALAGGELRLDASSASAALQETDIDPMRRAETLSVEEFVRLSNYIFSAIETVRSPKMLT